MAYKNIYKRYTNYLLLIVALCTAKPAEACFFEIDLNYSYYKSLLDYRLMADTSLAYFFPHYGHGPYLDRESDANLVLWQEYMDPRIPVEEVREVVYNFGKEDIQQMLRYVEKGVPMKLSEKKQNNRMSLWLVQKGKNALHYLLYAKEMEETIEKVMVNQAWQDEQKDPSKIREMERTIKSIAEQKDKFLAQRYLFMYLRYACYSGFYKKCHNWYQKYYLRGGYPENMIDGWVHGVMGRMFLQMRRREDAGYEYVKMYELAPDKYLTAEQSFQWTHASYDALRSRCRTQSEHQALAMLTANQGSQMLKPLYEPYYMRAVGTPVLELIGMKAYYAALGDSGIVQLANLIPVMEKISAKAQRDRKVFWDALITACAIESGKAEKSQKMLNKWAENSKQSDTMKQQWEVLSLVHSAKYGTDEETESQIKKLLPKMRETSFGKNWAKYLTKHYIVPKYAAQGDSSKQLSALMNIQDSYFNYGGSSGKENRVNRFGDIFYSYVTELLNQMSTAAIEDFIRKAESGSEYMFSPAYIGNINLDVIRDYLGTRYVGKQQWEDAARIFGAMEIDKEGKLPGSQKLIVAPFADFYNMKKYRKNTGSGELGNMSKLETVNAIMKEKKKADKGNTLSAYKYATALYNISYYGHDWLLSAFAWSTVDLSYYFRNSNYRYSSHFNHFDPEYFELHEAEKYARKAARKRSLRDDANFLAAMCTQKRWLKGKKSRNGGIEYAYQSKNSPYFKKISRKNTEIAQHCDYFRAYVGWNKRK